MFLKTLEMQGFKSFPDRVKIEIGQGLTAVVGPNGSGKSNVCDAIRWVLGEQSAKSLRGGKMEDVIFGGTQKRRPMGYAEVTLTIDNSTHNFDMDAEEIRVTRKYYRSGESDYLINGQNVRLKDIVELFMDTGLGRDGYSMIGQGKVDQIVDAKPLDRRYIFEEAAGIAKYRSRREEASHKLELAEENLLRLRDILAEKEQRLEPLRIQSEKAAQFIELDKKKRALEISLWVYKLDKLKQSLREQDNLILTAQGEYDSCSSQAEENEQKIQAVYNRMEEILREADGLREEKQQKEEEAARFGARSAVLQNDIDHARDQITRLENEIREIQTGGSDLEQKLADNETEQEILKNRIAAKKEEQVQLEEQLAHLNTENSDASDRLTEITTKINRITGECSNARVLLAGFKTTQDELNARLEKIGEERKISEGAIQSLKERGGKAADFLALLDEKETGNKNQQDGTRAILASRQQKMDTLTASWEKKQQEIARAEHRAAILNDMERNMEGFAYSVKFVLKKAENGRLGGIEGPVFRLVQAKEGFETAVETAFGGAMQNIVCRTEEDAKNAIRMLKQENGGRATFLPVNTIRGNRLNVSAVSRIPGFLGLASDRVDYDSRYSQIVLALLGRVVLAEDLDSAAEIARKGSYRFRVVTLDGQVVNTGGSLTGGSNAKNNGLMVRLAEIRRMEETASKLKQELEAEQKKAEPLQHEIDSLNASLTALEAEHMTMREDRAKAEAEAAALTRELRQAQDGLDSLNREEQDHTKRLERLEVSRAESEKTAKEAEEKIAGLEKEAEGISGSRADVKARRNQIFDDLNSCKLTVIEWSKDAENLIADRIRLTRQGESDEARIGKIQEEQEQYRQKIAELNQQIEDGGAEEKAMRDEIEAAEKKIAEKLSLRMSTEGEISSLRADGKQVQDRREELNGELIRLQERKKTMEQESERLIAGLMDEYEVSLTEAAEEAEPLEHPEKTQKEVGSLKWKIRQLGNVNLSAIEEYKEVKESYTFLSAQVGDVEQSKAQLLDLIDELGNTMKNLFTVEFGRINTHFSRIFTDLFGGGEAELTFTDPGDVLNSGVEIKAQPPGKLIHNLSSLSGGERAMVALSIFFAIMKVRPAPFCVLDEVDAPLDDVNVNRLTDYLIRMGDKTQFISITHNRGTMEAADLLYGVTMQEKGVTKVLSLDVAGAMAQLEKEKKN